MDATWGKVNQSLFQGVEVESRLQLVGNRENVGLNQSMTVAGSCHGPIRPSFRLGRYWIWIPLSRIS